MENLDKFFVCNGEFEDIFKRGNSTFLISREENESGGHTIITNAEYCNVEMNEVCIVGNINYQMIEQILKDNWWLVKELNYSIKGFLELPIGVQIKMLLDNGLQKVDLFPNSHRYKEKTKEQVVELINNF